MLKAQRQQAGGGLGGAAKGLPEKLRTLGPSRPNAVELSTQAVPECRPSVLGDTGEASEHRAQGGTSVLWSGSKCCRARLHLLSRTCHGAHESALKSAPAGCSAASLSQSTGQKPQQRDSCRAQAAAVNGHRHGSHLDSGSHTGQSRATRSSGLRSARVPPRLSNPWP